MRKHWRRLSIKLSSVAGWLVVKQQIQNVGKEAWRDKAGYRSASLTDCGSCALIGLLPNGGRLERDFNQDAAARRVAHDRCILAHREPYNLIAINVTRCKIAKSQLILRNTLDANRHSMPPLHEDDMGERILIIDGHPDPDRKRFCHALAEAYGEGARSTGKEVRLITVAESDIPLMRTAATFAAPPDHPAIQRAQADLLWCDHLVLVFPLWLGGAPSLLRAFLEQIARGSFMAETSGKGIRQKLRGRSGRVIVTMGMPAFIYRVMFHEHGVRNIIQGVLGFAGIAPIRHTLFGAVEAASKETLSRCLLRVRQLGRSSA